MACKVESGVEPLFYIYIYIDSVIREYHVYKDVWESNIGEVLQCRHDAHNHCDPLTLWVRQRSRNVHSFEVFEQRYRIKKSQAQSCDTCSKLKQK